MSVMVTAVYGLLAGNTCCAGSTPIGPTTCRSALVDVVGQPADVVEDIGLRLVPGSGATVLKPNVPAGGLALATPLLTSNADPAVTATTAAPDTNRVNNLLLCTIRLTLTDNRGINYRSRCSCYRKSSQGLFPEAC